MANLSLDGTPGINPVTNAFGKAYEGLQILPEEMEMPSMISPSCHSLGAAKHSFCQWDLSDESEGFFSSPLSASKANRDSFRKWEKTGVCSEKLWWTHYGITAVNASMLSADRAVSNSAF